MPVAISHDRDLRDSSGRRPAWSFQQGSGDAYTGGAATCQETKTTPQESRKRSIESSSEENAPERAGATGKPIRNVPQTTVRCLTFLFSGGGSEEGAGYFVHARSGAVRRKRAPTKAGSGFNMKPDSCALVGAVKCGVISGIPSKIYVLEYFVGSSGAYATWMPLYSEGPV